MISPSRCWYFSIAFCTLPSTFRMLAVHRDDGASRLLRACTPFCSFFEFCGDQARDEWTAYGRFVLTEVMVEMTDARPMTRKTGSVASCNIV